MARFLKPGELQVFQGPKVNRGYNIITSSGASAGLVGFFFRGMAQFLKPGELQLFQGPKVNRGYNITTNGAGCLVLAKLFVTSVFEKQIKVNFAI